MKTARAGWFSCRVWLPAIGAALIVFGLLLRSCYQVTVVSGASMLPSLKPGNVLLVDRRAYKQVEPERGDIVVARYAGDLIVKRVVGLPGEDVEVKQGRLYVNGVRVRENHGLYPGYLHVGKGKILPEDFATLGDNRAVSPATAVHPIITKADVLGKVVLVMGTKSL